MHKSSSALEWKDRTQTIDIPDVKECRMGNTVNMSFKQQSSIKDDTQTFHLIRQGNRAIIYKYIEEIFD